MDRPDDTISDNIEVVPVVVNVSFRIFPDHVEVDVLRSGASLGPGGAAPQAREAAGSGSFAEWMSGVLRREGLTMEAAARQLGVSVKTVSRWVGGTTEPRLRDLRRIRALFGEIPLT
jgi:hypothetical protein